MTKDASTAISAGLLEEAGVAHGFFTRAGGVSTGLYASLNGGVGSRDDPDAVAENRRRMAAHLGVAPTHFLVPYQIHSPDAVIVTEPFSERPRCDALATNVPGLGLGVTGADCGIVLFADASAGVIGAAHAGWKGALTGVLEATLAAMETLGANRASTIAVLGPTIGRESYEVGPEFYARFVELDEEYAAFFTPSSGEGRFMFDLPGFIGLRLGRAGVGRFEDLALDTYADADRFYSYRRSVHRQEADYGRLVAAIALV
ncbi:peptidoglycan editing factor PgeF [Methylocapsa acidiphila]|uniref:peptidoglycan editing factor PgeF n=1 Tax=Methylocapsa acidiphila TaxID=133552 RepID=UPI000417BBA1|nr:peptidoglycan editing factor PgeF [Methylocapsa acidiphila]